MYDGGIAYADQQLGKLIAELIRLGAYDNSLIVITADHGEGLADVHGIGHPGSVYQELINIPMVVKFPHQQSAQVVEYPVSQIDLLPTILAVTQAPSPTLLPGVDLRAQEPPRQRDLLSVSYPCWSATYSKLNRTTRALISGHTKYIESNTGAKELYDLDLDPMERHNGYTEEAASKSNALQLILNTIPQYRSSVSKADADALHSLKGLGYVQ
jgi:arylsulfatase A-like enzyme